MFPVVLVMFMVIGITFSLLVIDLLGFGSAYSEWYTRIEDAEAGDVVNIYGVVETPHDEAFNLSWNDTTEAYQLHDWVVFNLTEKGKASERILVTLKECDRFYFEHTPGRDTINITSGATISVTGDVKRSVGDGKLVVIAFRVDEKKRQEPTSVTSFSFTLAMSLPCAIIILLCTFVYLHRASKHAQYLLEHPPKQIGSDVEVPPSKGIVWHENKLYSSYKTYSIIACLILVILLSAFIFTLIINIQIIETFGLILLFPFIFSIPFVFSFTFAVFRTPKAIGITDKGLYLKYRKEDVPPTLPTSFSWEHIKSIDYRTMGSQVVVIESKDTTDYILVHRDVQEVIRTAMRKWKDDQAILGGPAHEAGPVSTPSETKVSPVKPMIMTEEIKWVRNSLVMYFQIAGAALTLLGLFGLYMIIFYYHLSDTENFWYALRLVTYPLLFGSMLFILGYFLPLTIGYSRAGIHIKYFFEKKSTTSKRVDFISWDDIGFVAPTMFRIVSIIKKDKEELKLMNIDPKISSNFGRMLDERYLSVHPEDRPRTNTAIQPEMMVNKCRKILWVIFWVPMITSLLFVSILPVALILSIRDIDMINVAIMVLAILVSCAIVIFLMYYPQLKCAPVSICFHSEGVHVNYGSMTPPPGTASFIGWREIARIEPLGEAFPDITRSSCMHDTKNKKYIVFVKKSGSSYLLGPIDPMFVEMVISNVHQVSK